MRLSTLFLLAALLLWVPGNIYGQQISPNPNPLGNTIPLNSSGGWYNSLIFPYVNNGTININSGGTLANWQLINNYGTLNVSGNLANVGTLYNSDTLTNSGLLTNNGTLNNLSGSTLHNYNILNNNNYCTLNNDGTIDTTYGTFTNNGTYGGTGTIIGNWFDKGILAPGNSAGVVTTEGDYYKQGGSKEIELGGHFNGGGDKSLTEFDWLDVTGNVELAGALDVYLIDSFQLLAGMSFNILNVGGTLTGQYDDLDEGKRVGTYSGTDLYITYAGGDGNDVTLFSRAVPEPAALLLALLGLALLPRRRRVE